MLIAEPLVKLVDRSSGRLIAFLAMYINFEVRISIDFGPQQVKTLIQELRKCFLVTSLSFNIM